MHFPKGYFFLLTSVFAQSSFALSLGELNLISYLNEPLRAQIEVQLTAGESLEDSCLSLSAGDGSGLNQLGNIPFRDIQLNFQADKNTIFLRSKQSFNEPFAIFQLKINCLNSGHLSKTFTLLPEVVTPDAQLTVSDSLSLPLTVAQSAVTPGPAHPTAPALAARVPPRIPYRSAAKVHKTGSMQLHREPPPFSLRLSQELALPPALPLSAETRRWLDLTHELLNETQSGDYLLNLQQQLIQTQQALVLSRQALKAVPPPAPAATPLTEALLKGWLKFLQTWRTPLLALCALLGLGLILNQLRLRRGRVLHRPSGNPLNSAYSQIIEKKALPHAEAAEKTTPDNSSSQLEEQEVAVLEEGELYAIYGHSDKGVKILQEYLTTHPNSEKVWLRLLSIYAAQGLANEFENAAKEFLILNKNSRLWRMMQALGRTLEKDNPLYADDSTQPLFPPSRSSTAEERQIGNILVEMGYVSEQDLNHALEDYDYHQHGKLGHYLVMHRLISHTQLDEALFRQQTMPRPRPKQEIVPGSDTVQLNIDLPTITPSDAPKVKKELFDFDWDFTQGKH